MRIIIASTFVPFINGGARFFVEWLERKLRDAGHEVERFYLPFVDTPEDLHEQIAALRLMDLTEACDRLIAVRPPAHMLRHPDKVLWFIHHIRSFYDLWGDEHGVKQTPQNMAIRKSLHIMDTVALREARQVFTNSQVVSNRLKIFNDVESTTLYPPILNPERFHCADYGDEIAMVSRVVPHKRQMLLIEAMQHTRTPVRLRLCGTAASAEYGQVVRGFIDAHRLGERIVFDDAWISEDSKAEVLSRTLACAYLPHDEDSYGYPCLEAAHARKAVITTTDSGGVLELVRDGLNGLVTAPDPHELARAMDRLYLDKRLAQRMGQANLARVGELSISWDHVVGALTA